MAEASATGVAGVGLLARVDQDVGPEVSNLQPGQTPFMTRSVDYQCQTPELAIIVLHISLPFASVTRSPEQIARRRCHSGKVSPLSECESESSD